ncbi:hypothetical protein JAAARDRAFT_118138 [Jaapia argillacea MUCL 33604]|uniref:Uncharacterized protein n=1 Tax=Jaapia argillacea MUCL 33604 TaxID=933084 RepID=A0A067QCE0_9AGAM|nr:hypothetical protein JAAARDRAFT_118138 [Jaapia argillacea MUCL 33604]
MYARPRKHPVPHGFLPSPKPKTKPIDQMSIRELHDQHAFNARILAAPSASTSTYFPRVSAEQAAIESRLLDLEGVASIQIGMKNTRISESLSMDIDPRPASPRMIPAKQRAWDRAGGVRSFPTPSSPYQEAVEIERRALENERTRKEEIMARKRRQGLPIKGEKLTRQEMDARMLAFLSHKPSESDMEDDDDDDESDDEDPSSWFVDDQDDGRKGQDIVEPDEEDLMDLISVDSSRLGYSAFYQPRDEGD